MRIGGTGLATGNPGGECTRGENIAAFVKMSDSCCRACQLTSAVGTSGLTGDEFTNDLVRSCAAVITRSAEDEMSIVRLDGNQSMVSAILSALVALLHTV